MTTKVQLEAQVAQLKEELAAAQAAVTPATPPKLPNFSNRVWLPKAQEINTEVTHQGNTFVPVKSGKCNNGSDFIEWSVQVDNYDKELGRRVYSKNRFILKAWKEQYEQVMQLIEADQRLVELTANFLPDTWKDQDGNERQADRWYVVSVAPISRKESNS